MADPADIQRLIGDLAREGIVVSVDLDAGTCRVRFADNLTTGEIPWLSGRAGKTRMWSPPSVGEQVAVLCPEADTARGILIGSLSSDANPHPASDQSMLAQFVDGARISYDPLGHALAVVLPGGATAMIDAPGGITLRGPVAIEGALSVSKTIEARDEITGNGIKLSDHKHGLVKVGTDKSGKPE